ncbi:MAG: hypothetical protein WKF66_21115 [Pedobacter sp.]
MKKIYYRMPRAARFIFIPIMAIAFLSLVSLVVMLLWNNLLPQIIQVEAVNIWQAAGIFILCKLLFGFGRMGGFRGDKTHFKNRMAERVKTMTPEERERFKEKLGSRMFNCCEDIRKGDGKNTASSQPEV